MKVLCLIIPLFSPLGFTGDSCYCNVSIPQSIFQVKPCYKRSHFHRAKVPAKVSINNKLVQCFDVKYYAIAYHITSQNTVKHSIPWYSTHSKVGQVCIQASSSCPSGWSLSQLLQHEARRYFSSLLDGLLVHQRATHSIKFAGTHLYT